MNTPLRGTVLVDGPTHDKKMRGAGAFFKGAGRCLKWPLGLLYVRVLANAWAAFIRTAQTRFISRLYGFPALRDISENYMFSAASTCVWPTGYICLLLPMNCARPASFGFSSPPEGNGKSHWFNNENDNQAVPMQPKQLCGVKPSSFGSSGPAGEYERNITTTNLDEPTFT